MLRSILIAAVLIVSAAGASAESRFAGLGSQTCGAWTANSPTRAGGGIGLLYQQWVFGFLSGISFADPEHDPFQGLEAGDLDRWMDDFCAKNSTSRIVDAAIGFVRERRR